MGNHGRRDKNADDTAHIDRFMDLLDEATYRSLRLEQRFARLAIALHSSESDAKAKLQQDDEDLEDLIAQYGGDTFDPMADMPRQLNNRSDIPDIRLLTDTDKTPEDDK